LAAEPRSGDDLARLLMEKAAGDEKILLRLIDDADIPDDGLGFHVQQAVEKMVKAILAHNGVSYERTHNIAYLLRLLDGAGISKPNGADDLPNLSPWAAELRYGRLPEAVPDRRQMRALVEQTKSWANAQLASAPDQGGDTGADNDG
jgi:HEPN domain-containing protein